MTSSPQFMDSFQAGVRSVLPASPGLIPFGLIYGVTAMKAHLTGFLASLFSITVFAGASQLAALDLYTSGAPLAVIVMTGLIINLRFVMYSASLAPHLQDRSLMERAFMGYILTDQAYALSVIRYDKATPVHKAGYYLGAAISLWCIWQASTLAGFLAGATAPPELNLDFAIPLTFMALIFPSINTRPKAFTAITSAIAAILLHNLPYNLGLIVAAIIGIATGFYLSEHKS